MEHVLALLKAEKEKQEKKVMEAFFKKEYALEEQAQKNVTDVDKLIKLIKLIC